MEVNIKSGSDSLKGDLIIPPHAKGIIIFVHGSGSSRFSPRNRDVAMKLNRDGFATLLFDLLTPKEAESRSNVFDIDLLVIRLMVVTSWVKGYKDTSLLPIGYFGASTGAAAALVAASMLDRLVSAVVSRGGRVDLAKESIEKVKSPTLLIVGEEDSDVLKLNYAVKRHLKCENEIAIVPGATHLFAEPGTLELVADLATSWFARHLGAINLSS